MTVMVVDHGRHSGSELRLGCNFKQRSVHEVKINGELVMLIAVQIPRWLDDL